MLQENESPITIDKDLGAMCEVNIFPCGHVVNVWHALSRACVRACETTTRISNTCVYL